MIPTSNFSINSKKVRNIIETAFANVQFPGEDYLLHATCQDSMEIDGLKGHSWEYWQDIPNDIIDYHYDSLPFLSPEAFQFFLPAYMIYGLNHKNSNVLTFTIYSLTAPDNPNYPEMMELFLSWIYQLTPEQKNAIVLFLKYNQQEYEQAKEQFNDAAQALKSYWINQPSKFNH